MFRQMLFVQWKASKLVMLPFVVAAFGLPLLSVQGLGGLPGGTDARSVAWMMLDAHTLWLPLFPLMALAVGVAAALVAWQWDYQGEHVYALSLPVPRWEYVLTKMGAGAVILGTCVVAFGVGAVVATSAVHLPGNLHAFPMRATLRFLFAALTAYAVFFALAAGSVRTAIITLTTLVVVLILGQVVVGFLGGVFPALEGRSFIDNLIRLLEHSPGPLHVFTGNWMLIDA